MEVTVETEVPVQVEATMDSDVDQVMDDGRSSSLSEIDEGSEAPNQDTPTNMDPEIEEDSEAETERIEITPNSAGGAKKMVLNTRLFEPSPSKLAQAAAIDGENMEEDKLSDSVISSPLDSTRESLSDELPEAEDDDDDEVDDAEQATIRQMQENARKRKRSLLDGDELTESANARSRRQRTGSVQSDRSVASEAGSDNASILSLEGTLEPAGTQDQDEEAIADKTDEVEDEPEIESKEIKNKVVGGRRRVLRSKPIDGDPRDEVEEPANQEDTVESDQEEGVENEDIDDAEAAAKSEEEAAKRLAAMESLAALEKHFATLRDRLYDERISSINNELAQLNGSKPSHPELLRQVKIVQKYRDDKFDIEQKLLVHKVEALKRHSVAERAIIHSSYFQTIRDLRERHLEKISEHFYRIQRDRFKTEDPIPNFTIPFPKDRLQQVSQQVAYNKEVSILAGVAKYVGFPAAPDLSGIRATELDEDMEKMGISLNRIKNRRTQQPQNTFSTAISRVGAEEQFLEQTPWANPQHPLSQQVSQEVQRLSRQASEHSRAHETPAGQQRQGENIAPQGSASTIALDQSAQASSAFNTPFGDQVSHAPMENGESRPNYRLSSSPIENRKTNAVQKNGELPGNESQEQQRSRTPSPVLVRAVAPATNSPRLGPTHDERIARHENASPLGLHRPNSGIVAGPGMGRFGLR